MNCFCALEVPQVNHEDAASSLWLRANRLTEHFPAFRIEMGCRWC